MLHLYQLIIITYVAVSIGAAVCWELLVVQGDRTGIGLAATVNDTRKASDLLLSPPSLSLAGNACIANHANEIMFHAGTSELQRFISCALSRSASAPHARRSSFPFPRVVQLTPSDGSCLTAQANSYLSAITTKVRYFMCWVNVLLHR